MRYWGKFIGFVFGYLFSRSLLGGLFGLFLGHLYDVVRRNRQGFFADQQTRQLVFFTTTFQVMGHVSKAKGRVTEEDIQVALRFMDRLRLDRQQREAAQQGFQEGKNEAYPLRQRLKMLRLMCFGRQDLLRVFLEIQMEMAFADGTLDRREQQVLYVIAEELGVSRAQLDCYLNMLEGGWQFQDADSQHAGTRKSTSTPTVEDAYKVLGIRAQDEVQKIKRAYRKLMNEHHPDKLIAKGLPPEMMTMTKQKTQEIQAAYDLIKRERGFK